MPDAGQHAGSSGSQEYVMCAKRMAEAETDADEENKR